HPALAFVEQYFRDSAVADGGWNYHSLALRGNKGKINMPSTPSMTCAGLLGLAVGHGVQVRAADNNKKADAAVDKGFKSLEKHLTAKAEGRGPLGIMAGRDFYLYWSIERVGMIYDVQKIGDREWYPWLSKLLVDAQKPNGSWGGPIHDDCFAL